LRKQLGNGFGRRGDLNAATHGQAQQITGRIVDKSPRGENPLPFVKKPQPF
jgi:hypothetical protein